jgi:hypothetical protein
MCKITASNGTNITTPLQQGSEEIAIEIGKGGVA